MSPCLLLRPHRSLPTFLAAIGLIALTSIRSKASGALWAGLLLGLGGALGSAPPAHADTFVVTTTSDHDDGTCDADCTLREAIAAANARPGTDTITFADGVTGTIGTESELPHLSSNLVIDGPGADLMRVSRFNNFDTYRIFTVPSGVTVTLRGLTIANGGSGSDGGFIVGGGIFNAGTLTVEYSTISGNTASLGGGIFNGGGTLTVTGTTVSGNSADETGGGILNHYDGMLTVQNSTISDNTATNGGGIFNESIDFLDDAGAGRLTVQNSTLSGNSADGGGGGIYNGGQLTVQNSTFSGNSADRGGGIDNPIGTGRLIIGNTILDRGAGGGNLRSSGATVTSQGYNLSDDDGGGFLTNNGDLINTDPQLGPLRDNGGPAFTHLPLPGSPAIDAGDTALDTDQRGVSRGLGAADDIGAVEVTPPLPGPDFVVTVNDDTDNSLYTPDDLSLREAILIANAGADASVITFDAAVTGAIDLTSALPALSTAIEIQGPGADVLTVRRSSGGTYRIFTVTSGASVTLSGLTLSNGDIGSGNGGAIHSSGTLAVSRVVVSGNAAFNGGGILNDGGALTVTESTIGGNTATSDGGGLYNNGGTLAVTESMLSDNTATDDGGGIYNPFGTLTVTGSTLSGNEAESGGGIYSNTNLTDQQTTVTNSTLSGNTASGRGGGFYNIDGLAVIESSTLTGNRAAVGEGSGLASLGNASTRTEVGNTLIAGNFITDVDVVGGAAGSFQSTGHNLIGHGNATSAFGQTGDQTGVSDPQLGPLADNGGPTETHRPQIGSPAIDAGDTDLATDQRGEARGQGTADDIGAVEASAAPSGPDFVVTVSEDSDDGDYSADDLSLREAILAANGNPDASVITFDAAVTGTINLTGVLPALSTAIEIQGPGAEVLTVRHDSGGNYNIFSVRSGANVTLSGLTISDGAGIFNNGTLTVEHCMLSGNTTSGDGGGIYNDGGTLTVTNSTFAGNTTSGRGGGIYNGFGPLTVTGSTFVDNTAGQGGGVYSETSSGFTGSFTLVQNSTFSGNSASVSGGAIHNKAGQTTVENSTLTGNRTPVGNGGGLASAGDAGARTVVTGSIVAGNLQPGGSDGTDVDLSNGTINSFESGRYNLIGDGDAAGTFTGAGDQTGVADPGLGPLADNGGPTLTHLPQPGSPAIDQGKSTLPSDQRGQGRPTDSAAHANADGGDGSDIGAIELTQAELPGTVGLAVAVTLWLEGGYDASASLMRTDLSGVLPETDPYGLGASVAAGFFTTDPTGERVVDWMHLQLRTGDPATAMTVEAEQAALLLDDGTLVNPVGTALTFDVVPGSYWFVALHRNHLGVMSSQPLDCTSGSCTLDFTAAGSAFGTEAQAELAADVFGLFSGDYDGNGEVTISDFTTYQNAFVEAIAGYEAADGNLDGEVTTADFTAYQNAFIQAVASQVPSVGSSAPTFSQAAGGQR